MGAEAVMHQSHVRDALSVRLKDSHTEVCCIQRVDEVRGKTRRLLAAGYLRLVVFLFVDAWFDLHGHAATKDHGVDAV